LCFFLFILATADDSQPSMTGFFKPTTPQAQGYSRGGPQQKLKTTSLVHNLIVACGMPLSIVDNPHFIEFCSDMDPQFHPPSRSHLSQKLLPAAVNQKETAVQNRLALAKFVSLTLDIWTDRRCHSFLAATVHSFVHCTPLTMLLSFIAFKGSHTGVRIAAEIDRIIEKSKLNGKVVHLVTDNASNMKKAAEVFRAFQIADDDDEIEDEADDDGTVDDDTVWDDLDADDRINVDQSLNKCCTSRLACFAHTLQLTVKDGLDKI